jgi:hypothetical protein
MPLAVADFMADGQVFRVAVAAFAQRLDVLQRGGLARDVFAADPARHHAVELPRHGLVDLVPGMPQPAHVAFSSGGYPGAAACWDQRSSAGSYSILAGRVSAGCDEGVFPLHGKTVVLVDTNTAGAIGVEADVAVAAARAASCWFPC